MRARSIFLGLGVSLVAAVPALTQYPQGGAPGGGFGEGGGTRRFTMDPGKMFDQLSGGKAVWVRAEISDPGKQGMFDRVAERLHITTGQITREQFVGNTESSSTQRNSAGGPAPGSNPGTGAPAGGGGSGVPDSVVERIFRSQDQNGDGVLNYDEMPDRLRLELNKWDTDGNGLIDLTEFKAWFRVSISHELAERIKTEGFDAIAGSIAGAGERTRPVAYRPGHLPAELPAWFTQLDSDGDGQIGLYEWKTSGRPLEEFDRIDRNGDGFLTVDEVLRYEALQRAGARPWANAGTVSSAPRSASLRYGAPPVRPGDAAADRGRKQ
jgi:hypothetical protein